MSSLMTFLNASLLIGAAAFAIPLIIHLLNRSRFKSLDWGAMMFLEDALRANSRRLEWQKWLLLLLRCAIPICLALCMARPLLQNSSMTPMLAGSQTSATCLLIDNSLSMEAKFDGAGEGGKTVLDKAKRFALEAIQSAARNSRWSIDPIGANESESAGIVSRDVKRQTALIDQIPQGSGGVDFLAAMDGAIAKLAKTSESQRRILVVSDFQKTMCQDIEPTQVATLRQRYAAMPNPPSIVFLAL